MTGRGCWGDTAGCIGITRKGMFFNDACRVTISVAYRAIRSVLRGDECSPYRFQRFEDAAINAFHTRGERLVSQEDDGYLVAFGHIESINHQSVAVGYICGSDNDARG